MKILPTAAASQSKTGLCTGVDFWKQFCACSHGDARLEKSLHLSGGSREYVPAAVFATWKLCPCSVAGFRSRAIAIAGEDYFPVVLGPCGTRAPPAGLEPAIFGLEVQRLVH